MKLKRQIVLFWLLLIIGISFIDLFSQNIQKKPTRQSSLEAFSKGNYEQAYNEFSELLLTYSKDPLYKYYSGVCLVRLKRDISKAVSFLGEALHGVAAVRSLPSDAIFYLGRAQQMSGSFLEAVESYNLYTNQVGKRAAREQGVPGYIQQCNENKGEIPAVADNLVENVRTDKAVVNTTDNKQVISDAIQQPVRNDISEKEILPSGYDNILDEALNFQFKSDSIKTLISKLKIDLDKLPNDEKEVLTSKISENELLATTFQRSADLRYAEAQVAMNSQNEKNQQVTPSQQTDIKVTIDSVKQTNNNILKPDEKQADTIKKIVPAINKPAETFKFFEVLPKPVTDPNEKIIIDPEVPEGLIYRIQVAVFRNPVAPAYFKGITPVFGFKLTGTDKTNYYAGMFRRSSDAHKALASVKAKGFNDAFVVALSGKKAVSPDRAASLEKEWRNIPFVDIMKSISETPVDTVPPTLSFRVEVIRSSKPLKDEILGGIKKIAGNRGLDIQQLDDGNIVCLIGKFITFESAAAFADLLVRNGYREAKVGAWLGKKEIPVDIARQLFDNLE
ncbi:MAG TPA: SPOR domain-containing protein [Bacteroidales bacterium]|nr:SPOR domain-containing protein [Bacteroidales bacterium]